MAAPIIQEEWQGADFDPWPQSKWMTYSSGTGGVVIYAGLGFMSSGNAGGYADINIAWYQGKKFQNAELLVRVNLNDPISEQYVSVRLRDSVSAFLGTTDYNQYVNFAPNSGVYYVGRTVAGADSSTSVGHSYSAGVPVWLRYRLWRDNVYVKVWNDGSSEPSSWSHTGTGDAAGMRDGWLQLIQLGGSAASAKICSFDFLQVWDLDNRTTNDPAVLWFPNSTNATPSPAVATLTTTAPAPTVIADATVSPAVAALTMTAPAPTATGETSATPTPDVAAVTSTAPAPTVTGEQYATVTPSVAAVTMTAPAPTTIGEQYADTAPAVVALTSTAPVPSLAADQVTAPSVVAVTLGSPSPSASGGSDAPIDVMLFDSDRTGNFEIYRLINGTSEQLTSNASYDSWWPKPSPDGSKILFCRTPAGVHDTDYEQVSLWVMDADGANVTQIYAVGANSWSLMGHPEWSPDGNSFVMFAGVSGTVQLILVGWPNTSTPSVISVTGDTGHKFDPSVSPDFDVYYRSETDGQIYKVFIFGGARTQITSNAWSNYDPYVSPDGTKVAWLVNVTGIEYSIRYANADGSSSDWVWNDGNINSKPAWAPGSDRVYFHRNPPGAEGGIWGLFYMPIPPLGSPVEMTEGAGSNEYPAVGGGSDIARPAVVPITVGIPAPVVSASRTIEPSVVALTTTAPAATATGASNASPTPAVTALTMTAPAPTATGEQSPTVTPAVAALTAGMPASSQTVAETVTPAVAPLVVAIPQADAIVAVNSTATPAVAALTIAALNSTVFAESNATVSPAVVQLLVNTIDATISAGATVAADPFALTLSILQATIFIVVAGDITGSSGSASLDHRAGVALSAHKAGVGEVRHGSSEARLLNTIGSPQWL